MLFVLDIWLRYAFVRLAATAGSNIIFIIVQMFLLTAYVSLRKRKFTNIFKGYFGLGDLLFLLCIAFYFSCLNYIAFYLLSLMIVVVLTLIFSGRNRAEKEKIPLAGYQALFLILIMIVSFLIKSVDIHSDEVFFNLLPYGN
ncbi:hypothetical protein ACTJKN_02505 [Pedobacter sp. 22163]|uniref:hypothetical protein n=1 Tax=Pedobacter sp. 22163 TaxID=3453883 RepID=UPI003F85403B